MGAQGGGVNKELNPQMLQMKYPMMKTGIKKTSSNVKIFATLMEMKRKFVGCQIWNGAIVCLNVVNKFC